MHNKFVTNITYMIKITTIVEQIVKESDFVEMALSNNFLNLTEYARFIQKEIQNRTMKSVQLGSIVVALSRLKIQHKDQKNSRPDFRISELSIKSPLSEIVYEKTQINLLAVKKVYAELNINPAMFLTITQSSSEIMITTNSQFSKKITDFFGESKPKIEEKDLVGIRVHLEGNISNQPGILYSLLKGLAWKNISIIDLISTYTEFIVIVRRIHAKKAFEIMNDMYTSQNQM
jgi:hypothetical protein